MARILVIEDELFYRQWLKDCLEELGHQAYLASTAREGLDLARQSNPDLALVDIILPGNMDGLAVLFKLQKQHPQMPVIMLTAYDDKKLIISALRRGAFDYLVKPISKQELEHSLNNALERAQLLKDREAKLAKLSQLEKGTGWLKDLVQGRVDLSRLSEAYQLLETTVELVSQVLECERVSVMLLDPKQQRLRVVVSKGMSQSLIRKETRSVEKSPSGWVLKNKQAVLVKDVNQDERFSASEYASQYKTNSFIIAPLVVGGEVVGTINANDKVDGEVFDQDDLILLQTFAHQVALTLQYLQAMAELEQEKKRLKILVELEKILLEEQAPEQMLKKILKKCQEMLEVVGISIYLREESGALSHIAGWDSTREIKFEHKIEWGKPLTGKVASLRKSILLNESKKANLYAQVEYPKPVKIKNYLAVPVLMDNQVRGVIRALNRREGKFTRKDLLFLEEVSRLVGIALRNLELWKKLEQSVEEVILMNQRLRKLNQELGKRHLKK